MTPEDLKALEAIDAAKAAGTDPFGDDEPLGVAPDETEPEAVADEVTPEQTDEPVAEAEPEAEPEAPAEPEPGIDDPLPPLQEAPQSYKTDMPADYKAQRTALLAERAAAMKKLMEGELEAGEFAEAEARISDALEELTAMRIRAETLHEANIQGQQRYQQQAINRLVSKTKSEVDYASDEVARNQFDTALQVIAAQPANKDKDFADLIDSAHIMVKAMRGVMTAPVVAPSTKSPPDRKPGGDPPPVTLRSLPSASTPNTGSVVDQIARLKGPAYEAAFSKLTPAQKAALLDAD